jgi:hypothetical protein
MLSFQNNINRYKFLVDFIFKMIKYKDNNVINITIIKG